MAVSRAINNIGYVREETRERILEPANALNYRPTLAAKPLVTRRNRTIACAMANTSDPFHNLVGKGIEAVAFQKRCTTLMCDTHSAGRDRDCIDLLMSHRPGGAVFHRPNVKPERAAELAESGVHCVMMDNETKPEGVGAVGTDDALGSAMAAEDLFSRGHRRSAAFATCWSTHPAGGDPPRGLLPIPHPAGAVPGLCKGLRALGPEPSGMFWGGGRFDRMEGLANGIVESVMGMPDRPAARYCENDIMAVAMLRAFVRRGVRVPDEGSLIGRDDLDLCGMVLSDMTTIVQPGYEMGRAAAQMLIDRIEGRGSPREIVLKPTVWRGETA